MKKAPTTVTWKKDEDFLADYLDSATTSKAVYLKDLLLLDYRAKEAGLSLQALLQAALAQISHNQPSMPSTYYARPKDETTVFGKVGESDWV